MIFQSWGYSEAVTDGQLVAEEVRLGELAEELGFDALWPVGHNSRTAPSAPTTRCSSPSAA